MADFALLVRVTLAAIFGVAALAKSRNLRAYSEAVSGYRLGPAAVARVVSYLVPPAEGLIAVALLLGFHVSFALAAAGGLLIVFALAGAFALFQGRRPECGCLGSAGRLRVSWLSVLANTAMAAAAFGTVNQPVVAAPLGSGVRSAGSQEVVVLVLLALLLAATYWLALYAESVAARLDETLMAGD